MVFQLYRKKSWYKMDLNCICRNLDNKMERIYVLKLKGNRYYVGKSNNIPTRYKQHKSGEGCSWTSKFQVEKILEIRDIKSEFDENNVTKEYMKKYGIDNVRGGAYCSVYLSDEDVITLQKELCSVGDKCYKCGKSGHYARDCVDWEEYNQLDEREAGACYRCGRNSHWQQDCFAKTHIRGYYLDD